jgi:nucleotide-binding universal stress UspA family protein
MNCTERDGVMKRILVATDGSAGASAAVDAALELAHDTGALVTVVCVRHVPELLGNPLYQRALSRELREGRAVIDEAVARAERAGVAVESELLTGHAAEEIVRLAEARGVDLVAVGSHGRGRIATALLGSVANTVVHTAPSPVLVVTQKAEELLAAV